MPSVKSYFKLHYVNTPGGTRHLKLHTIRFFSSGTDLYILRDLEQAYPEGLTEFDLQKRYPLENITPPLKSLIKRGFIVGIQP